MSGNAKFRTLYWWGLALLWAALVWGAWAGWGRPTGTDLSRIPPWARMLSSAVLVAMALLTARRSVAGRLRSVAWLVALGMSLGLLGDLCIAGWLGVVGVSAIAGGMAAFGLGHLAYLGALARTGGRPELVAWLVALGLGVVGWFFIVYRAEPSSAFLAWTALGYVLLLASVAGVAVGVAGNDLVYLPFALGTTLFFASDLILSLYLFRPDVFASFPDAWRGDVTWLLYGTGQFLIVSSVPLAARVGSGSKRYRPVPLLPLEA